MHAKLSVSEPGAVQSNIRTKADPFKDYVFIDPFTKAPLNIPSPLQQLIQNLHLGNETGI